MNGFALDSLHDEEHNRHTVRDEEPGGGQRDDGVEGYCGADVDYADEACEGGAEDNGIQG